VLPPLILVGGHGFDVCRRVACLFAQFWCARHLYYTESGCGGIEA